MQERVVGFLKDLWETLKRELKGPEVKSVITGPSFTEIKDKNFTNIQLPNIRAIEKKTEVFDLNDNITNLEIKNGMFEKKSSMIKLFKDIFSMTEKSITFNNEKIKITEIAISKDKIRINKLRIEESLCKIEKIILEKTGVKIENIKFAWKTKVNDGKEKIYSVPKRIKGKRDQDFTAEEFKKIEMKIKKKMMGAALYNYKIESVFAAIPIKCVKNIKFYIDKNEIELFLREGNSKESADFVILRNKITGNLEKIFI